MSFYSWVTDHHNTFAEMRSDRLWTGKNYKYKYYILAYSYNRGTNFQTTNDHYKLCFSSKQEMAYFFRKFSIKFNKTRNDRYDYDARKYFYDPVSVQQLIEITEETIKEMQYSKRKTSKLFQTLFENL